MQDNVRSLQEENDRLKNLAQRDGLTGLYNRKTMEELINQSLQTHAQGTMIVLDADKFKGINDSFGHLAGDHVLRRIAEVLVDLFRFGDLIGRIGGDEYLIFLPGMEREEMVERRILRMNTLLKDTKLPSGIRCPVQVTHGYSAAQEGDTYTSVFQRADADLIESKKAKHTQREFVPFTENGSETQNISMDVVHIRNDLVEHGAIHGAYLLSYEAFRNVFRFVERGLSRMDKKSHIILFTLMDNKDKFIPLQIRSRQMGILSDAIETSLRVGDAYTKYSSCQYLIMAIGVDQEHVETLAERITRTFQNKTMKDSPRTVCLNHIVYPMYGVEQREDMPLSM